MKVLAATVLALFWMMPLMMPPAQAQQDQSNQPDTAKQSAAPKDKKRAADKSDETSKSETAKPAETGKSEEATDKEEHYDVSEVPPVITHHSSRSAANPHLYGHRGPAPAQTR